MEHQNNSNKPNVDNAPVWEREVIEKLVYAALREQKSTRCWGIFFKCLMFAYLLALLGIVAFPKFKVSMTSANEYHTAVVNIAGMIAENKETNAADIIESLRSAVKDEKTKGIILHANSPGGSPVQSAYIYEEIRFIKKNHPNLPIYAVVSDMCASGCYYIVSAADKIYVNPSSLIGSIGVLMDGFGFVDVMQKFGVERRLLTAGAHKAMLDPFSPVKEDEKSYMKDLLNQVHVQFINAVKAGRGERLKETDDMFSGLVWTGEGALSLGLVDEFGAEDYVAKEVIGAENKVDFTKQEKLLDKVAGKFGIAFGQAIQQIMHRSTLQ
ncbi:MAG: signal peptide peptidase SppA [Methylococcaceae bacterium]|nr:MAG: signal peptide peptidase SppA [Methylococcaceae bacterium]